VLRIAVIWTELSGYLAAGLRIAARRSDVALNVTSVMAGRSESTRRAYRRELFEDLPGLDVVEERTTLGRIRRLRQVVKEFDPDAILYVWQWRYREWLFLPSEWRREGRAVIGATDTPWRSTGRQRLATFCGRLGVAPSLDAAWVPGVRAEAYARRLFGSSVRLFRGLYSADSNLFRGEEPKPVDGTCDGRHEFVFVGRLVEEKGVADLARAYARYRSGNTDPWGLRVIGAGPERARLEGREGVTLEDFSVPEAIAQRLGAAGALVLPSLFEPWGVVVHEAFLMGTPVICSSEVSAGTELIAEYGGGIIVPAGDAEALAMAMREVAEKNDLRGRLRREAWVAGNAYTSEDWAERLVQIAREVCRRQEGSGSEPTANTWSGCSVE